MRLIASLTMRDDSSAVLAFTYYGPTVEWLKNNVSPAYREWNQTKKVWIVREPFIEIVRQKFENSKKWNFTFKPKVEREDRGPFEGFNFGGFRSSSLGSYDDGYRAGDDAGYRRGFAQGLANGSTGHRASVGDDPYAAMFEQLHPRLREAAYKRLLMALHPDVGGDEDECKRLTAAYAKFAQASRN